MGNVIRRELNFEIDDEIPIPKTKVKKEQKTPQPITYPEIEVPITPIPKEDDNKFITKKPKQRQDLIRDENYDMTTNFYI